MVFYVLRRMVAGLVLSVLVTFITFMLLSRVQDSTVRAVLGGTASDEAVAAKAAELGFDRPVLTQYFDWLGRMFRGDFGRSIFTNEPVGSAAASRLVITMTIVLVALALAAVISVLLGVVAAYRGGVIDRVLQVVSLTGTIVPGMLVAILAVMVFAVNLGWLPAGGFTHFGDNPGLWARSIAMPVGVLMLSGIANMAAQIRGAMVDELRKDYVRTLRTRGLPVRAIVLRHALRNAASPALTVMGFEFIAMLGGALFLEAIFALPGFVTFSFNASMRGDIPVVMGLSAFSVLMVFSINLLIDLANSWLNPKARLA